MHIGIYAGQQELWGNAFMAAPPTGPPTWTGTGHFIKGGTTSPPPVPPHPPSEQHRACSRPFTLAKTWRSRPSIQSLEIK